MPTFKPSGRDCAGTQTRGQYVMPSTWSAPAWPKTFDIEAEEQTVPADGKAMVGCGRETRVTLVRAGRGATPMFRKTAECVVCPHCDFGIET